MLIKLANLVTSLRQESIGDSYLYNVRFRILFVNKRSVNVNNVNHIDFKWFWPALWVGLGPFGLFIGWYSDWYHPAIKANGFSEDEISYLERCGINMVGINRKIDQFWRS